MTISYPDMRRPHVTALILEQRPLRHPTRLITLMALALGIVALLALLSRPAFAQATTDKGEPDGACELGWHIVPSINAGDETTLREVTVVSADNIWAVGYYYNGATSRTLIERWNGTSWATVNSPNVGTGSNYLEGVDAVSASQIWAVGYYVDGATSRTLVLRWNGTSWSVATSANAGLDSDDNFLLDVEAVSASDGWAVGHYRSGGVDRTLILRWNGSAWLGVSSPNVGANINILQSVSVLTANDVWAVGWYYDGSVYRTLTQRWNGTSWATVTSANQGATGNFLYSVQAVSANNVWAVGAYGSIGTYQTLILRWNGTSWSVVSSPNIGTRSNVLLGMDMVESNNIWAVGFYANTATTERTLTLRWNGSTWVNVSSANTTMDENRLYGVAAVTQDNLWSVGYSRDSDYRPLVERYSCAPCDIQFTDVLPGSTFYDFVRCMACQDIITGYTSGCETGNPCFRPNNNVTRGQLSKIVANAAGFAEAVGAQQYHDVAPGSTFYDFVWRLSNRGHVGGYPCGGPNEPCVPPGDLPYFRPNANASRGQISKIVAEAANFNDPPGAQLFEDVDPGTTFYDFVQRLANENVMGGYPCGGPGEPCIAPGNLPYFRPSSNATRGQTSKIVANTFFPTCDFPRRPEDRK